MIIWVSLIANLLEHQRNVGDFVGECEDIIVLPRRSLTRFNAERTEAAIVIADAIKDIGSIIPSKSLVDDGNGLFATYFIAGSKAEA